MELGIDWADKVAGMEVVSCNGDGADDASVDDDNGGLTCVVLELSVAGAAIKPVGVA